MIPSRTLPGGRAPFTLPPRNRSATFAAFAGGRADATRGPIHRQAIDQERSWEPAMAWTTISVTLSLLISLSLTRLLTGLVAIFRARRRAALDWIPIAWAAVFILTLLESWIALNDLSHLMASFTFVEYLSLAGLLMLLFAAASLLLPPGELVEGDSLKEYFAEEGRFALVMYAGYLAAGAIVNVTLFGSPVFALWSIMDAAMIFLPVLAFYTTNHRRLAGITLIYIPLLMTDVWIALTG